MLSSTVYEGGPLVDKNGHFIGTKMPIFNNFGNSSQPHFVVETRLAMIHVCTSNENAYQERRVSYLRGIFDGLKKDLEPMRKNRGMRRTQEYTFEVVGRFFYCDGIYRTSSEVQCETVSCL